MGSGIRLLLTLTMSLYLDKTDINWFLMSANSDYLAHWIVHYDYSGKIRDFNFKATFEVGL